MVRPMRASIRRLLGIGSAQNQSDLKEETPPDLPLGAIAAASPDPKLAPSNDAAYAAEKREGVADRALAKSETPFWMLHVFGELPMEFRLPIGLFAIIVIISSLLSIFNVANAVVGQLMDLLKAVLGGLIGGAVVKRTGNGKPPSGA